jgi:hypothetical protein
VNFKVIDILNSVFCELRNSHLECGNSLPPLTAEFIPPQKQGDSAKLISRNKAVTSSRTPGMLRIKKKSCGLWPPDLEMTF